MTELWTVGHSTRAHEELLGLLQQNGIQALTDVRRYPASRRHPHFNRENLEMWLPQVGCDYVWE